ncbi:MAG: hypothetical protein M3256_12435, partial [Actinomycetota bacterium]|nr:hypothetical protein [Actinomycetota bacterium]
MSQQQSAPIVPSPQRRCSTRALKNAQYLRQVAPNALPSAESDEGFGTGIPIDVLARLHRLPADHPDLQPYEALSSFLSSNQMPLPLAGAARGELFNGTIYFVQVTFNTPGRSFMINDSDMNTIVAYTKHAVVPICDYASQYGQNSAAVNGSFLRYSVTLGGTSYSDADLKGWVNDIVRSNRLPSSCCIALPSPQGLSISEVSGNAGYHGKANVPYTVFGVYATGLTLQDLPDVYAMVVSHELAELIVDPDVSHTNPEVCDPCDLNCGPLHRCYFDDLDTYLASTAALPPGFDFSYYVCAVVQPDAAASCPAGDGSCDYVPALQAAMLEYGAGGRIASAHQTTMHQLDAFAVGADGALNVLWVTDEGAWSGPAPLTSPGFAPAGAAVAT